jgi:hypothetical protein
MAKIRRPAGWTWRLISETAVYEILGALVSMAIGFIAAGKFFADKQPGVGWTFIVLTTLVGSFAIIKHVLAFLQKEKRHSPHDLESSLHALHAVLLVGKGDKAFRLRITIHTPIDHNRKLEQLLDYVGDDQKRQTAGRTFPVQSGIIGKAFRSKQALVAKRKNSDSRKYVEELVEEWGYTPEDAAQRDMSSMTWMAVPLEGKDGSIDGIVYLDATDAEFFDDTKKNLVIYACVGIASYAAKRYT